MNRRSMQRMSRRGSQLGRRLYRRGMRGAAVFPDDPQSRQMGSAGSPRAQRATRSLRATNN